MLLDGAFRALLLPPLLLVVINGASAVTVPPPTNLRVSCRNLNVIASWEFSREQQPPTVFRVDVKRTDWSDVRNTTEHQYDLTGFIWPYENSYLDNFYVEVTAEQGTNRSDTVQSKTFSFNTEKTTDITCELDFPPVDLKWTDSGATVSYRNPFHVYSLKAKEPSAAFFELNASTNASNGSSKTYSNKCTANEENCKLDVSFLGGVEKCVTLEGTLFASNKVGDIEFRKVESICVDEPADDHLLALLAVLLAVVALVVTLIIVSICATRAWTMKTNEHQPFSLWPVPCKQDLRYIIVADPAMVVVTLTENNLKKDDKSTENLQDGGFCSVSEGGFSASSKREQEREALMYRGLDESADSSLKTECVSLQSDESGDEEQQEEQQEVEEEVEFIRNYDRPQNLQMDNVQVDMGDGEMVTAYLGR